jgi:hypothetical protein
MTSAAHLSKAVGRQCRDVLENFGSIIDFAKLTKLAQRSLSAHHDPNRAISPVSHEYALNEKHRNDGENVVPGRGGPRGRISCVTSQDLR